MLLNFQTIVQKSRVAVYVWSYQSQPGWVFREALQKTGVNIKPILLRLKDRQKSVNDRKRP